MYFCQTKRKNKRFCENDNSIVIISPYKLFSESRLKTISKFTAYNNIVNSLIIIEW